MNTQDQQWATALTAVLLTLAVIYMTSALKKGVFRMRRNGAMLVDQDGWQLTLADDTFWIARFGKDWRKRYHSTWAFGYKRSHMWFIKSKGEEDGASTN